MQTSHRTIDLIDGENNEYIIQVNTIYAIFVCTRNFLPLSAFFWHFWNASQAIWSRLYWFLVTFSRVHRSVSVFALIVKHSFSSWFDNLSYFSTIDYILREIEICHEMLQMERNYEFAFCWAVAVRRHQVHGYL